MSEYKNNIPKMICDTWILEKYLGFLVPGATGKTEDIPVVARYNYGPGRLSCTEEEANDPKYIEQSIRKGAAVASAILSPYSLFLSNTLGEVGIKKMTKELLQSDDSDWAGNWTPGIDSLFKGSVGHETPVCQFIGSALADTPGDACFAFSISSYVNNQTYLVYINVILYDVGPEFNKFEVFKQISKEEADSIEDQTLVFQPHIDGREEGNHFLFIGSTSQTTAWTCVHGMIDKDFLSKSGSTISSLTDIIILAKNRPEEFERYFSVVSRSESSNYDCRVFLSIVTNPDFNWDEFEAAYPEAA